jgi:hypothetical protein
MSSLSQVQKQKRKIKNFLLSLEGGHKKVYSYMIIQTITNANENTKQESKKEMFSIRNIKLRKKY